MNTVDWVLVAICGTPLAVAIIIIIFNCMQSKRSNTVTFKSYPPPPRPIPPPRHNMLPRIIAIDFDGTLCTEAYPAIGEPIQATIQRAKQAKEKGAKLILWTCREGPLLDEAVEWCRERGLKFDAVNDNLEIAKAHYGNNPRKVGYDELWDDRALVYKAPS